MWSHCLRLKHNGDSITGLALLNKIAGAAGPTMVSGEGSISKRHSSPQKSHRLRSQYIWSSHLLSVGFGEIHSSCDKRDQALLASCDYIFQARVGSILHSGMGDRP